MHSWLATVVSSIRHLSSLGRQLRRTVETSWEEGGRRGRAPAAEDRKHRIWADQLELLPHQLPSLLASRRRRRSCFPFRSSLAPTSLHPSRSLSLSSSVFREQTEQISAIVSGSRLHTQPPRLLSPLHPSATRGGSSFGLRSPPSSIEFRATCVTPALFPACARLSPASARQRLPCILRHGCTRRPGCCIPAAGDRKAGECRGEGSARGARH